MTLLHNAATHFDWKPEPAGEAVVRDVLALATSLPFAATLERRLLDEAGVRLMDLVDTIYLADSSPLLHAAMSAGWEMADDRADDRIYRNERGVFPQIVVAPGSTAGQVGIDLKVESVSDFLATHGLSGEIVGSVDHLWRRAVVASSAGAATLGVVERHGWRGLETDQSVSVSARQRVYESFLLRDRAGGEASGFDAAEQRIDSAIEEVGRDVTCELFFAAERFFWMRRNAAGTLQFQRQQALGIGWANHDHHTYRSSREFFHRLVAVWEKLGFVCRERFYAGREAGWGAQVMEQPVTGIVTFNDVDLSPNELVADFSHQGLSPRDKLGTIGLWCGLHGESFNAGGMHHLEAMFGFDALRTQLIEAGVNVMKPFTDFGYLRQAFTEGERWPVAQHRVDRLVSLKLITPEQGKTFLEKGALGSHLENLERNAGFKGFNQTGVSEIIAATDPRRNG